MAHASEIIACAIAEAVGSEVVVGDVVGVVAGYSSSEGIVGAEVG